MPRVSMSELKALFDNLEAAASTSEHPLSVMYRGRIRDALLDLRDKTFETASLHWENNNRRISLKHIEDWMIRLSEQARSPNKEEIYNIQYQVIHLISESKTNAEKGIGLNAISPLTGKEK